MSDPQKVTYLGKVDFRNKELPFGIKARDRTRHMYVIGKTGMGKSTLLENLAIQDINNGEGVCVIDPHGSMAEKLLDYIPESRVKDVVYFAPFDGDNPIGLNVLEKVTPDKRHLVANGVMAAFKKLFKDQFSARMEYILNNIILALLENDGQSLLGVNRMLTDKEYRKQIVSNVTDPTVKDFWEKEYANYTDRFAAEAAPAIQNKVGQFVANPLIRNIIGQQKTSFDIRELMDNKKILIVNLSKGKVGEGNANLIGSLLITKIYLAAMSRADVGHAELEKLPPFYFYVDEFQNFANESFASILSEARKYNLALTVAHQYVEQMEDEVKSAVFGNVGTMVVFRVGATDAEIFEKEFAPYFTMDDIVNLSAFQVYLRLMIDGVGSNPFSASMLPPIQKPAISYEQAVIAYTRTTYGKPRFVVEEEIAAFYKPIYKEPAPKPAATFDKPAQQQSSSYQQHNTPYQQNGAPYQSAQTRTPQRESFQEREKPRRDDRVQGGREEACAREERRLPIRKITDQTPLPPRRFESRREEPQRKDERRDIYAENRSIEEQFHKPPHVSSKPSFEEKKPQESPLKTITTHTFDDKPAVSLKDALAKALKEKDNDAHGVQAEVAIQDSTQKEVSEDVLRKLLED
jgi:Type IV secretion-system coupling protein DNA-binding domain